MALRKWFHYYLLIVGSIIFTLGIVLIFRILWTQASSLGLILGFSLVFYGFLRLRQFKQAIQKKG
jgi:mannose/fructose/N-acetylgalactosamine-specific phosphotransferase system component IIC